jgi:WD40 repeat protein
MKEYENHLTPDGLDRQTERWSGELSQAERCLIQDLYALSQAYAQENERSLGRIWNRFVHSQAYPALLQERQALQDEQISREICSSTLSSCSTQQPRRSFGRTLSTGVAAAVMFLTIWSWVLLSSALHPGSHTGPTTLAGSSQKGVSSGKLLCSASYSTRAPLELVQPPLDWSARGVIATANPYLQIFSAQTCTSQPLINLSKTLVRPVWAPDGKRLLLLHGDVAEVLDASTGQVITSFPADRDGQFDQGVWTSDGKQIVTCELVTYLSHTTTREKVQVWNASNGTPLHTALTFDGVLLGSAWISPNGRYLALQKSDHRLEFWNIGTGKLVSTTSASVAGNAQAIAWSPSGTSLAVALPDPGWPTTPAEVQVWSTVSGQLIVSFTDSDTFEGYIGGLAWAPNGKYLAESSAEIHIWDIAARRLVATFGKVATKTMSSTSKATIFSQIASVAWAPNGSMLASVTDSSTYPSASGSSRQDTLNVWQLL